MCHMDLIAYLIDVLIIGSQQIRHMLLERMVCLVMAK